MGQKTLEGASVHYGAHAQLLRRAAGYSLLSELRRELRGTFRGTRLLAENPKSFDWGYYALR